MASTLITNIGELVTCDPTLGDGSRLGIMSGAALVIEDEQVAWVGPAGSAPTTDSAFDAQGRCVVPGFVDSHTHLVFAGDRAAEFASRMDGELYSGGGIMTTVAATRAATDDELRANTRRLIAEAIASGTTTVEIKSGYGLSVEAERRLLAIAGEFTAETTFLGAHVVPAEYAENRTAYVALVAGEMLEACAPLARWIDVFCDRGAFDADETREVLAAGVSAGLGVRLHGNQLGFGPGAQLAVEFGAASVDHCAYLSGADIDALSGSGVVATLLPGADFSTRGPYPDARRLLDSGVHVALATDCNPGSSFTTSMPLMIALAVREMRMTPAEALLAATLGGARALRRSDIGFVAEEASADFAVLAAPSYVHLAYRPGVSLVDAVWKSGERVF